MTVLPSGGSDSRPRPRWLRLLLFLSGGGFVGVGVLGIILPLLPSTVFFLLAAACFARSSPAAHRWLLENRIVGSRIRDYQEHRGATRGTKLWALLTLWAGIGASIWLTGFAIWTAVPLLLVAVGVSVHLLHLRTVPAHG